MWSAFIAVECLSYPSNLLVLFLLQQCALTYRDASLDNCMQTVSYIPLSSRHRNMVEQWYCATNYRDLPSSNESLGSSLASKGALASRRTMVN